MIEEIRFTATEVNCYVEDDVTIIGIGDDVVSPDHFIILSRFDEEDIDNSIGLMTHLSDIEAINTLVKITLDRKNITLTLKNNVVITIYLDIEDNHFIQLNDYLQQILQGSSIKLIEK
ncbi:MULTISPECIES: hypothetical protein [Proteus]|uniref:Uncharacterized protein n=1 Tax=Proteus penneri TaxID=102862 RepID=A0ABS0VZB8_9GAMM|nr:MULTISPECIES: hypothetical protein [Proteus]MBJ2116401.1 hypothetical protein [Proteus penneri]MCO8050572.1 hypothetical protein [Proteus penneri]MCX2587074.1 hypothetical protein [Proteus penneri]NBL76994.1 hypothetical protein [Proteus sp. G2672]NBL89009.1 hypothetical protein [Proteus sp. G2673]